MKNENREKSSVDFIRAIINEDLKNGKNGGRVHTRFPPEPNGYLHIGHAKSICLNFGLASDYPGGLCNLRFDDTNPVKEDQEYIDSITEDIRWLGFRWNGEIKHASHYFDAFYECALKLIQEGKAYVDSLSAEEIREYRGTPVIPGKESPWRNRSREENLDLFERMKNGEFNEGDHILRAKIDMQHVNVHMRDPAIYRIRKVRHHTTGDRWCIYPMYDFAHCLEDAIEGITHSVCTLEFENHRPVYDWFLDQLDFNIHPQQIEFARLNLSHTVMSKRKLKELVDTKLVEGWDDPRMPTISGMRRRGYAAASIRKFCKQIGVSKVNSMIDHSFLEFIVREDLNESADRVMAVLDPVKIILTNYPENSSEEFEAVNNPGNEHAGSRMVPFSRELWIDRSDFMEDPPKKYFRLAPGREVRLKHAFFITCNEVIKDESGAVTELHCTYDPESRGGESPDGRKVKGTIQWVSAEHGLTVEVRQYDKLFTLENLSSLPEGRDYRDYLNPDSCLVINNAVVEPSLQERKTGEVVQFMRLGYYCKDRDSTEDKLVFNRTVALKDSWAKIQKAF